MRLESVSERWVRTQAFSRLPSEGVSADGASPVESTICKEEARMLRQALRGLSPVERAVLRRRFGYNGRLTSRIAVAQGLRLTPGRVRGAERSGVQKLREAFQKGGHYV